MNPRHTRTRGRGKRRLYLAAPLALLFLFQSGHAQDNNLNAMFLSGRKVLPAFEGWWTNDDGSFEMFFGYMNQNWQQELNVPIGPNNYIAFTEPGVDEPAYDPSVADQGQPTHFFPRRNPFLFTVQVPEGFGDSEVVWTLTANGNTSRVYGTLVLDYNVDPQSMSLEVGGSYGSQNDSLRYNIPPELEVEGDEHRNVRVGETLTLVAVAHDRDNLPPERPPRGVPETLEELYRPLRMGSVASTPGLGLSWIVYRGPGRQVTFDPLQRKTWMDTRPYANSPWSPPLVLPEQPPGGRWVTQVIFGEPGEYTLRAVARDGSMFTYENVMVTVTAPAL
jgi:hypothetical protein